MLRSFGKIRPQIDQIWAWLSRGHRWAPGVRNPLKSSVTGPSLLVNCYHELKFHKIIRVNSPPPLMHSKNPMDIYNRIVGPVNCNKADTSVVEFKIYKRIIQQFTIKALALKVNKMICKTKYYFFGSKNEGYFITSSKIDVTKYFNNRRRQ